MIEVTELRDLLGLGEDTSKDDQLARLEVAAVSFIERETGHSFGVTAATTLYVMGTDTNRLYLTDVIATPVILERLYPGATDTTAVTDFAVRTGYLIRTGGAVWTKEYEYQVDGNAGYASGAEPEDIRQAVRDLVRLAYQTDGGTLKSEAIGGYSYTRSAFGDGDWSMLQETLRNWRGYPVA